MFPSIAPYSGRFLKHHRTTQRILSHSSCCRSYSSLNLDPPQLNEASVQHATAYKAVTVVDTLSDAGYALRQLLQLRSEKPVAWNVQSETYIQRDGNKSPFFTMSAYAGKEVNFGNGPHLFIRGQSDKERDRIWNLLRPYFSDPDSPKVWLDYAAVRNGICQSGIEMQGFTGDLVTAVNLLDKEMEFSNLRSLAKVFMNHRELTRSSAVLSTHNLACDSTDHEPWLNVQDPSISHVDNSWTVQACLNASLTYHLFQELQNKLEAMNIQGQNSTYDFLSDIHNLHEVHSSFFVLLARELYKVQSSGLPIDLALLRSSKQKQEQQICSLESDFIEWASEFSPEAMYMNLSSPAQLRQLLFAPCKNVNVTSRELPLLRTFKSNGESNRKSVEQVMQPDDSLRVRSFTLKGRGAKSKVHTPNGWPSTSKQALRKAVGFPRAYTPNFGQKDKELCYAVDSLLSAWDLRKNEVHSKHGIISMIAEDGRIHAPFYVNSKTGYLQISCDGLTDGDHIQDLKSGLAASAGNMLIMGQYKHLELCILSQLSECDDLKSRLAAPADSHELAAYMLFDRVREAVDKGMCRFGSYSTEMTSGNGTAKSFSHAILASSNESGIINDGECLRPVAVAYPDLFWKAKMLDDAVVSGGINPFRDEKVSDYETETGAGLLARWYRAHEAVAKWRKECVSIAESQGYIETMMGRRKKTEKLANMNAKSLGGTRKRMKVAENKIIRNMAEASALRYAVSGSAGEAVMGAMIKLGQDSTLEALGWRLVFVDEGLIVLEGPEYGTEEVAPIVRDIMESPMEFALDVDLSVEVLSGSSISEMRVDRNAI